MSYIRTREDRGVDLVSGGEFVDPATRALGWIGRAVTVMVTCSV